MVLAAIVAGFGCSDTIPPEVRRTFDRPSALAFTCHGDMRVTGGGEAEPGQPIVKSPIPPAACAEWLARARASSSEPVDPGPPGQEEHEGERPGVPGMFTFVLQTAQGSVAMIGPGADGASVPRDPDPLSPGLNTIPMGVLPVAIATDPTGCHVVTANAGSCDLSVLDVSSAIEPLERPMVRRVRITSAAGEAIGARPYDMAGDPRATPVGVECTDELDSLLYVAYPDCNLVAVVHAGTGEVVAGIRFGPGGLGDISITDGNVDCAAAQCGGIVADFEGAPRPTVVSVEGDTRRLFIGFDNSPSIAVVELDEAFLPEDAWAAPLEGDVGVIALAPTRTLRYGGTEPFQFVYAVTTDGTVRVVEVEQGSGECDTQVDTRYLHDERDVSFLPCMPVHDPRTPPRRASARSPGIHVPGNMLPLDVAFAELEYEGTEERPSPTIFHGYFAFITTTQPRIFVVNVDDRRYPEIEPLNPDDSITVDIALALPHQLRDRGTRRDEWWTSCNWTADARESFRPRLASEPGYGGFSRSDSISEGRKHLLPQLHNVACVDDDSKTRAVPALSLMADATTHRRAFPDLASIPVEEGWTLVWEGVVSQDLPGQVIDGPPVRRGVLREQGGEIALEDSSAPFCRMGVETFDVVELMFCTGDVQCSGSDVCFRHPDTPASVVGGLCLPADRVDEMASSCEDFLTTKRRYAVTASPHRDWLVLGERRRVLRTMPATGCIDDGHCKDLYENNESVLFSDSQSDLDSRPELANRWSCEPDPTRPGEIHRCVMGCDAQNPCEEGYACSNGYCVEGVLPRSGCLPPTVQRYQVQVGEAFAVIGSQSGFLHNVIADPDTGECIQDPEGHPLRIGRLPLVAPPCEGDASTDITPNPCSTTLEQVEYALEQRDGTCQPRRVKQDEPPLDDATTRDGVEAIRFSNPSFRLHLVDPTTSGSAEEDTCDRDGADEPYATVSPGVSIGFRVVGGLVPLVYEMAVTSPVTRRMTYPVAIARGVDGNMWVADQGDRSAVVRGQVLWFNPSAPSDINHNNYLQ